MPNDLHRHFLSLLIWVLAVSSITGAMADAILLTNDEEYSGRVVATNSGTLSFDIECSGTVQDIPWSWVSSVEISKQCQNDHVLGRGGRDWCLGSTFTYYVGSTHDEDFAADIIKSDDGLSYRLFHEGTVTKMPRTDIDFIFKVDCVDGNFDAR